MDTPAPVPECAGRVSPFSLSSACFWVTPWMLSWVKVPIAFATISVPRLIYLSYSMTLTLDLWSCAILFGASAVALNYWIRLRSHNTYSQLREPPLVKPDVNALHPDVNMTEPPPVSHNYLDDFLQAVRIFGFLEKPVFHELASHLQTKRLIAGDSISLDQDRNFYCVIDGSVQVFARTCQTAQSGSWDDEDMNGYQLINEVGSGGTLSSLFGILSLFTDRIKLSWQEDAPPIPSTNLLQLIIPQKPDEPQYADMSHLDLESEKSLLPSLHHDQTASDSSSGSTAHPVESVRGAADSSGSHTASNVTSPPWPESNHLRHGIIGRATEDSTLAVIPAQAFRKVTKKFPKATAHIVQVILTRFSRVTFNAAHNCLGLTTEVLRTEKAINEIACHPLPDSFYEGGGLRSLHQRFDDVAVQEPDSESDHLSHEPSQPAFSSGKGDSSASAIFPREKFAESPAATIPESPISPTSPMLTRTFPLRKHHQVQAGDLLTSTGQGSDWYRSRSRTFSILNTPRTTTSEDMTFTPRLTGDEFNLRDEVMSCIAKSIGLLQPPISGVASTGDSPALPPLDASKSPPGTSPFTSLSLLDAGDDNMSNVTESSSTATGYMSGLDNEVEILFFSAGSTLVKTGERNTGLYYVIEGFLDILLPTEMQGHVPPASQSKTSGPDTDSMFTYDQTRSDGNRRETHKLLFTVKPGGIAGYLASLCGIPSYVDIQAKTDTYVGFLSAKALDRLLEKRPIVQLTLAKRLISLLSPLVLQIDASLDWMHVNAGQVLWRPQDVSDSFCIVINGRLRSITEGENGKVTITGEYGQGDTVGELDVITNSPRRTTMHAIRDSELIRMPQTLFNAISSRNPRATAQLLRTIASRVRREVDASSNVNRSSIVTELGRNLKTVAILPVSRHVPIDTFARKLKAALEEMGARTSYLNQASVSGHLGRHAFSRMGKLKAAAWLADQEEPYRIVLYVADSPVSSPWTHTCIRQADFVMVVGIGDDPSIGEYERLLLSMKTTARKDLVLLHPERSVVPGSTREWLKNRPWVHQHTHVELPGLVMPIAKVSLPQDPQAALAFENLKDKVQGGNQRYRGVRMHARPQRQPMTNDFSRLARKLCGKSVGVVLGGGGARGLSHVGVIRALEERGIPIDYIAGTSIGAFIAGLYAQDNDLIRCTSRTKQFCRRMGNIWSMLLDVTYPLVAYTTGHDFNRKVYQTFYDLHIEDMWLPFFCNTTNLNTSCMDIHETGYAWRFIRASMTLAGMLPPLCDNGSMLVDGGYLDNLPVSTMLSMGASIVFAADPGAIDDNSPRNYGDSLSGWGLLLNRWNPFSPVDNIPAIPAIQGRLTYTTSVRTLEEAKVTRGVLYMGMPVLEYGLLDFNKYDEIEKRGYWAAREFLDRWEEQGKLPSLIIDGPNAAKSKAARKGRSARRNSI